ncbi:MAG: hypothetical protein JRH08_15850 [Deltaproteobacteria bacterium]|nr:hypothetical protein [Deltaproteobacteria bacterium]MBW2127103.1 hypothetical protein [Deltaproteobacteria bacterium]
MSQPVEFTKDGKVVIPLYLWNQIKELAEYLYLEELIRYRGNRPGVVSPDKLIEEEGLTRDDLEG